jgi:ferric-dicitrate binding protein FerR (iron transport regulator)
VRTGSGSGAVLELADGSRVELAARSQLTLARRSDGVVLDLERGALIVEAAEQKRGHLYVRTDDCLVSVVGTIFSVHHGVRGSRVSVLDGEVRVDGGTVRHAVLRPGDQLATSAQLGRVALADEIAWSRNAADYRERIAALAALGRELDATLATGGRTSTALVDRAPADTAIWVGLPNVADELSRRGRSSSSG